MFTTALMHFYICFDQAPKNHKKSEAKLCCLQNHMPPQSPTHPPTHNTVFRPLCKSVGTMAGPQTADTPVLACHFPSTKFKLIKPKQKLSHHQPWWQRPLALLCGRGPSVLPPKLSGELRRTGLATPRSQRDAFRPAILWTRLSCEVSEHTPAVCNGLGEEICKMVGSPFHHAPDCKTIFINFRRLISARQKKMEVWECTMSVGKWTQMNKKNIKECMHMTRWSNGLLHIDLPSNWGQLGQIVMLHCCILLHTFATLEHENWQRFHMVLLVLAPCLALLESCLGTPQNDTKSRQCPGMPLGVVYFVRSYHVHIHVPTGGLQNGWIQEIHDGFQNHSRESNNTAMSSNATW